MREDLNKVLCEDYRLGGGLSYHDLRPDAEEYFDLHEDLDDDIPHKGDSSRGRIGIRKIYGWSKKHFNENLSPLKGIIRKNVGRPWDKVYSEICKVFDKRSVINQHILIHLEQYVETKHIVVSKGKVYYQDIGRWRWRQVSAEDGLIPIRESSVEWYVDPRDGILKENRHRISHRTASRKSAERRRKEQLDWKREFTDGSEIERAKNGIWYKSVFVVTQATEIIEVEVNRRNTITGEIETYKEKRRQHPLVRQFDGRMVRGPKVLVEYKALSKDELKFYGVENHYIEEQNTISNAKLKKLARRRK